MSKYSLSKDTVRRRHMEYYKLLPYSRLATVTLSQTCVSKCIRLHLTAYSFQKISVGEGIPLEPLGSSWPSVTRGVSSKRKILDRTRYTTSRTPGCTSLTSPRAVPCPGWEACVPLKSPELHRRWESCAPGRCNHAG